MKSRRLTILNIRFSSNPCSEAGIIRQKNCDVNPSTGGENEHRERAPRSRWPSPRAITTRSPGMSATALRSATADRVPADWCRQTAHETGVDDDPPRTDRPAAPTSAWWPGLFTQERRLVSPSIGGKTRCFRRWSIAAVRSRANHNSPMWLNRGA
jgi:hypothetical protein